MKKRRLGLVYKCLIVLFIVTGLFLVSIMSKHYYSDKKRCISEKKIEVRFALNIIKTRIDWVQRELDSLASDLSSVFNLLSPSNLKMNKLISSFGLPTEIYGLGYISLPGVNSYSEYIYSDKSGTHYVDVKKVLPHYYTHPWFAVPEQSKKRFIEYPTKNKIGDNSEYMITCSYPYLDNNNEFKGVFVFDLPLEWFTERLDKSIETDEIDVSMFFPEEPPSHKIQFIKNTNIKVLEEQNKLTELIEVVKSNNGLYHLDENMNGDKIIGTVHSIFDNRAFVMVTVNEELIIKQLKNILYHDLFISIFSLLFLFVSFYFILKKIFKPIEKISNNVQQISKGNFDVDISVKSGAIEVIRLNEAIHKMQIQLKHYVEKMKKTAELDTELKIAANIQKSVIPKPISAIKGHSNIDLFQFLKPAREASGDFYDYFMLDDENLFISIGDVTGKGVPASLFTVMMISMEKMYKSVPLSMSETMSLVNREIIPMNDLNIFVSYFCMVINLKTGKARYANAGHDSPFIIKENGEVFQLKQGTGTFLGIFEHFEYSEEHYNFKKGDSILMYTDGVTEAMNSSNDLFGKDRTLKALSYIKKSDSAKNIIDNVNKAIAVHTKGAPQSDDICMTCLKFKLL
jgi:sigma-B regulation protein RsbU (phosphoserine phosphatase)